LRSYFLSLLIAIAMSACANASKISAVRLGMTKQEVISVMGTPTSVSAQGKSEFLNYALSETDDHAFLGITTPYYVRLIDGRVESFGRLGDFNSTRPPTVRIENDQNINQEVKVKTTDDLYTELQKLKQLQDSGVITEEEFRAQKKRLLEKRQ
jgi:outer membrane protein assembly factor BamE (lipoprotein component of BamABCDE complex)